MTSAFVWLAYSLARFSPFSANRFSKWVIRTTPQAATPAMRAQRCLSAPVAPSAHTETTATATPRAAEKSRNR